MTKITRHSALLTCRLFRTFLDFTINAAPPPTFIRKLCYKLSSIVTLTFIHIFLSKLCLLYWMASELPRLLDTASKFALFSASGLKESNPTWKLKHTNSILESFKYFCQISSKLILTILSYTVSNLVHFLRHSVLRYLICMKLGQLFLRKITEIVTLCTLPRDVTF